MKTDFDKLKELFEGFGLSFEIVQEGDQCKTIRLPSEVYVEFLFTKDGVFEGTWIAE